jgi:carboxypeptidase C (cathepsin A)
MLAMKKMVLFMITIAFLFSPDIQDRAYADGQEKSGQKSGPMVSAPFDEGKPEGLSVTRHTVILNNRPIKYKSTAGYMQMRNDARELQSTIFFVAYTREGESDMKTRPITFAFNGGPGSAALWLHMGVLGPKRVVMSEDGFMVPQPFCYEVNENSWLDFTDLVFIDPVSTGYSRPAPGVDKKKFHGVKEDIASVGDFIRLYVTRYGRWLSPKFLCGESYGTTRAAGLSGYLQDTAGMYLQGVVLISAVMHFQTSDFTPGNDLPYILFLPTYTASAWFHKKLPEKYQRNLDETLKEVESWALNDYILALAKGNRLTESERKQVIGRLSGYTGLSESFIDENDLRVNIYDFVCELKRGEKQTIGRLDSRFVSDDSFAFFKEGFMGDPSYSAIHGPYMAAINDYLRNELDYKNDLPYLALSDQVYPWNWGKNQGFVNVAKTLRSAMIKNKYLKVMIANGYYDLATPYFATRYTVDHLNLPPELLRNITMTYYPAGHMMYIQKSSRKKLHDDAFEFYRAFPQ